ncbi:MAG: quinolinate synthase NadA, partial [Nanoarchaeota archaeon]|nr:quinolinate synthase NadA [Nanoarchaeota archaeon]
ADAIGDSYGLSVAAKSSKAKKIIFCSVHFMGETAKILSPEKEVLVPAVAGCSLADSITAEDIRKLRKEHPKAGVVCYINTSAAVKAECDACCTSSNALKIIDAMPQEEVIFVPDKLMGRNLQPLTKKKLILTNGTCIVHEEFTPESVRAIRAQYPGVKILAHPECSPSVVSEVDFIGSTSQILKYVQDSKDRDFMLVTECGITDRVNIEKKEKNIYGSCVLCPYMKKITLAGVLKALKNPSEDQIVKIDPKVLQRAKACIENMFVLEKRYGQLKRS